ncbi:3'(2'),5'-bisphosphate nucleotidase CysQ [Indioceanicola profundi]|uniref:3'(2'),5'-bisphosphate nucleotidase CysQ n=1 Tax=Indioceanicola profundi TaxID=2220096 RepID=UPI001CECD092|nr:3'(2'),5'-bisphosphate nucleotidase CysQ [Indioceanicola profundi]
MTAAYSDPAALLPGMAEAARAAGAAILHHYEAGVDPSRKADGSPVTAADTAAEAVITPALRALAPDIPVIAEEAFSRGEIPDLSTGPFWLVDPLDGTKEFLKRNGEFTVNIALVTRDGPLAGVVYLPVTGEMFTGCGPGTAARQLGSGPAESIQARRAPDAGLTVMVSRSHADTEKLEGFLKDWPVAERVVAGSSLKFCRIAQGLADLYPRLGPTMEWDTAAGHAVLDAAGGRVVKLDGSPFTYGKSGFLNGNFLARGA